MHPCRNTPAGVFLKHQSDMKDYRYRLWQATVRAFGLYMGFRVNGLDGEVQLQRYKLLDRKLKEYDENH